MSSRTALVLSGGVEPYADPWHPFAATGAELAGIAAAAGFRVEMSFDGVSRLADLGGIDLLIANIPNPVEPLDPAKLRDARAGLAEFLSRPVGVLALHVSVTTLLGIPQWTSLIGARWVAGQTMHPPRGFARVRTVGANHLVADIAEFELDDELYTRLTFDADVEVLVDHEYDDASQPLVWVREVDGVRVVADALGHDARSYESDEHAQILKRAMLWAVADR